MKLSKKLFLICILALMIALVLSSCSRYSEKEKQARMEMFESFEHSDQFIVQTKYQILVNEKKIEVEKIQYQGQQCEPIFLEAGGFYAYAYNADRTELNLLYIDYDNTQTELLNTFAIPSKIIGACYANHAFYFRVDDPDTAEFNQLYMIYDLHSKEIKRENVNDVDVMEAAIDQNRSTDYQLEYHDSAFGSDSVTVTHKATGVTKKITKSALGTCEEGKLINRNQKIDSFDISRIFVKGNDFYVVSYFGLDSLGTPCFFYIWKWNFETEKAEYHTAIYFDTYPESIRDLYIP